MKTSLTPDMARVPMTPQEALQYCYDVIDLFPEPLYRAALRRLFSTFLLSRAIADHKRRGLNMTLGDVDRWMRIFVFQYAPKCIAEAQP